MKAAGFGTRVLSGALCAVMALQSGLAAEGGSSVWVERRRQAAQRMAALPAAPPAELPSLPAAGPVPLSPALSRAVAERLPPGFASSHAALLASLPYAFGTVRKVTLPEGPVRRVVVHVHDVHHNADAQRNIGRAVRALADAGQADLVALEGAFGPVDLAGLRGFSRPDILAKTADHLLSVHKITGPVHAAVTGPKAFPPVIGVDDPVHYAANVEAYRRAAPRLAERRAAFRARAADLDRRKDAAFNPALLALDRLSRAYHTDGKGLGEYLKALAAATPAGRAPPAVRRFLEALALEASLDFRRLESERAVLVGGLVRRLDAERVRALVERSAAHRRGEVGYADFYAFLQGLCREAGLDLGAHPAFARYVRYTALADGVDAEKLMEDIAALETAAFDALARTPEERALTRESRTLALSAKLADFSLSPEEYKVLRAAPRVGEDAADFEAFYEEAHARDGAMAENVLKAMDAVRARAAVLVTGGYHGPGVARALRRAGTAVVSFTPRIETVEDAGGAAYLGVFTRDKTPLEKLFQGRALFLGTNPHDFSTAPGVAGALAAAETWRAGARGRRLAEVTRRVMAEAVEKATFGGAEKAALLARIARFALEVSAKAGPDGRLTVAVSAGEPGRGTTTSYSLECDAQLNVLGNVRSAAAPSARERLAILLRWPAQGAVRLLLLARRLPAAWAELPLFLLLDSLGPSHKAWFLNWLDHGRSRRTFGGVVERAALLEASGHLRRMVHAVTGSRLAAAFAVAAEHAGHNASGLAPADLRGENADLIEALSRRLETEGLDNPDVAELLVDAAFAAPGAQAAVVSILLENVLRPGTRPELLPVLAESLRQVMTVAMAPSDGQVAGWFKVLSSAGGAGAEARDAALKNFLLPIAFNLPGTVTTDRLERALTAFGDLPDADLFLHFVAADPGVPANARERARRLWEERTRTGRNALAPQPLPRGPLSLVVDFPQSWTSLSGVLCWEYLLLPLLEEYPQLSLRLRSRAFPPFSHPRVSWSPTDRPAPQADGKLPIDGGLDELAFHRMRARMGAGLWVSRALSVAPEDMPAGEEGERESLMPWSQLVEQQRDSLLPPGPSDVTRGNYWQNSFEMRRRLSSLLDGPVWDRLSVTEFSGVLRGLHRVAASGERGDRPYKVFASEVQLGGRFRDYDAREVIPSQSIDEARASVSETAGRHGLDDPFLNDLNGRLRLPGIPEAALPRNTYVDGGDPYSAYIEHSHPPRTASGRYSSVIFDAFKRARRNDGDPAALVRDLSVFFQYAINLMPFHAINKSFFMNIVNLLLQRAGLQGVAHENADYVAFVAQPETFFRYLWDRVVAANPQLADVKLPEPGAEAPTPAGAPAPLPPDVLRPHAASPFESGWIDAPVSRDKKACLAALGIDERGMPTDRPWLLLEPVEYFDVGSTSDSIDRHVDFWTSRGAVVFVIQGRVLDYQGYEPLYEPDRLFHPDRVRLIQVGDRQRRDVLNVIAAADGVIARSKEYLFWADRLGAAVIRDLSEKSPGGLAFKPRPETGKSAWLEEHVPVQDAPTPSPRYREDKMAARDAAVYRLKAAVPGHADVFEQVFRKDYPVTRDFVHGRRPGRPFVVRRFIDAVFALARADGGTPENTRIVFLQTGAEPLAEMARAYAAVTGDPFAGRVHSVWANMANWYRMQAADGRDQKALFVKYLHDQGLLDPGTRRLLIVDTDTRNNTWGTERIFHGTLLDPGVMAEASRRFGLPLPVWNQGEGSPRLTMLYMLLGKGQAPPDLPSDYARLPILPFKDVDPLGDRDAEVASVTLPIDHLSPLNGMEGVLALSADGVVRPRPEAPYGQSYRGREHEIRHHLQYAGLVMGLLATLEAEGRDVDAYAGEYLKRLEYRLTHRVDQDGELLRPGHPVLTAEEIAGPVAVSGGTGFLGGHFTGLLLRETGDVRLLTRGLPAGAAAPAAEIVTGSFLEPVALRALMKGAGVYFHLAADSSTGVPHANHAGAAQILKANALAPALALLAAREAGVARQVFVSSFDVTKVPREADAWVRAAAARIAAYARAYHDAAGKVDEAPDAFFRAMAEDYSAQAFQKVPPYPVSKRLMEEVLERLMRERKITGVFIVRIMGLVGLDMEKSSNSGFLIKLIKAMLEEKERPAGQKLTPYASLTASLIHVDDVAAALLRLARRGTDPGPREAPVLLEIGGERIAWEDVVRTVEDAAAERGLDRTRLRRNVTPVAAPEGFKNVETVVNMHAFETFAGRPFIRPVRRVIREMTHELIDRGAAGAAPEPTMILPSTWAKAWRHLAWRYALHRGWRRLTRRLPMAEGEWRSAVTLAALRRVAPREGPRLEERLGRFAEREYAAFRRSRGAARALGMSAPVPPYEEWRADAGTVRRLLFELWVREVYAPRRENNAFLFRAGKTLARRHPLGDPAGVEKGVAFIKGQALWGAVLGWACGALVDQAFTLLLAFTPLSGLLPVDSPPAVAGSLLIVLGSVYAGASFFQVSAHRAWNRASDTPLIFGRFRRAARAPTLESLWEEVEKKGVHAFPSILSTGVHALPSPRDRFVFLAGLISHPRWGNAPAVVSGAAQALARVVKDAPELRTGVLRETLAGAAARFASEKYTKEGAEIQRVADGLNPALRSDPPDAALRGLVRRSLREFEDLREAAKPNVENDRPYDADGDLRLRYNMVLGRRALLFRTESTAVYKRDLATLGALIGELRRLSDPGPGRRSPMVFKDTWAQADSALERRYARYRRKTLNPETPGEWRAEVMAEELRRVMPPGEKSLDDWLERLWEREYEVAMRLKRDSRIPPSAPPPTFEQWLSRRGRVDKLVFDYWVRLVYAPRAERNAFIFRAERTLRERHHPGAEADVRKGVEYIKAHVHVGAAAGWTAGLVVNTGLFFLLAFTPLSGFLDAVSPEALLVYGPLQALLTSAGAAVLQDRGHRRWNADPSRRPMVFAGPAAPAAEGRLAEAILRGLPAADAYSVRELLDPAVVPARLARRVAEGAPGGLSTRRAAWDRLATVFGFDARVAAMVPLPAEALRDKANLLATARAALRLHRGPVIFLVRAADAAFVPSAFRRLAGRRLVDGAPEALFADGFLSLKVVRDHAPGLPHIRTYLPQGYTPSFAGVEADARFAADQLLPLVWLSETFERLRDVARLIAAAA